MRIKVAEVLISSFHLDLVWQCSNCGKVNLSKQSISAESDTKRDNPTEANMKKLQKTLDSLQCEDVSLRYDHVDFTCACDSCDHKEPWMKTYNKLFTNLFAFAMTALVICAIIMAFAFKSFYQSLIRGDFLGIFLLCVILISVGVLLSTYYIKKRHLNNIHQEILQLPSSAIPRIYTHNPSRHLYFFRMRDTIKTVDDLEKYT